MFLFYFYFFFSMQVGLEYRVGQCICRRLGDRPTKGSLPKSAKGSWPLMSLDFSLDVLVISLSMLQRAQGDEI
jgi:hypothetical protein